MLTLGLHLPLDSGLSKASVPTWTASRVVHEMQFRSNSDRHVHLMGRRAGRARENTYAHPGRAPGVRNAASLARLAAGQSASVS
jgi:hypothetical protein